MDRKDVLNLVPEDQREKVSGWLDTEAEAVREAGKRTVAYERRTSEKTITDLTAERDTLSGKVDEYKTKVTDASGASAKATDLERQLATLTTERDKLLPVVEKHRAGLLRTTVIEAAKLKDDLLADALIVKMSLTLGDDDKLSEEHTKKLTEWAADEANAGRVKGAETDASNKPGFPVAPPIGSSKANNLSDPMKAWASRLTEKEQAVLAATAK